jgi:hypothetical protein
MKAWLAALRAETLKLRRTLALGVVVAAPALVVGLNFLVLLRGKLPGQLPADPWASALGTALQLWGYLMLPLLVALVSALVNHQDHQQGLHRVFFSLPVPRARLYLARLAVVLGLLALSTVVLGLLGLLSGTLLAILKPALGFGAVAPPLGRMARMAFTPLGGGLLVVALMAWLCHRVAGMALALGVGMGGTVGSLIIANSPRWGHFYPWSLPGRAMNPLAPDHAFILALSAIGFVVVTALACWEAGRREVA